MKFPFLNSSDPNQNASTQGGAWSDSLSSPETRAALLQTGLAMLSGGGGGNIGQQLAYSIGSGLEARDRVIANEQKQKETAQELALKNQAAAMDAEGLNLRKQQLAADISNQQAARQIDQQQLKISQQNADTARMSATKPVSTSAALTEERANRAAWLKFVTERMAEATTMDIAAPSIDELAAEWASIGGVVPSTVVSAKTQAAAAPVPETTRVIDGKTYVQRDGKWYVK